MNLPPSTPAGNASSAFAPAPLDDLAVRINEAHRRATAAAESAVEHAIEAGRLLIEAKAQCQHGDWQAWLESNFAGSARTAQAYMRVARKIGDLPKAQRAAHLPLRQVVELIADHREVVTDADALKAVDRAIEAMNQRSAVLAIELENASTIPEVMRIRNEAHQMQNDMAEIKLRLERRIGALFGELQQEVKNGPAIDKLLGADRSLIPSPGMAMLFVQERDGWRDELLIEPSTSEDYYFVTVVHKPPDNGDWHAEGMQKPILASAVSLMCQHLGFDKIISQGEREEIVDEPHRFNQWLFVDHGDYMQRVVLGKAVPV